MTKGLAKSRLKHVLKMNTELCKEIVYNLPLEMGSGSDVQKKQFEDDTANSLLYLISGEKGACRFILY